jgi:hypothetical protein
MDCRKYTNGKLHKHSITGVCIYLDKTEAPKGYYAVEKDSIKSNENVCHFCEWRKDCNANVCSCMSYNRKDGVGVFFKKLSPSS